MRWIELSVPVSPELETQTVAILEKYGQGGATVEESSSKDNGEKIIFVKIYVPHSRNYKSVKDEIEQALSQLPSRVSLNERQLKPEDWLDSMKQDFKEMEIGRIFTIRPSWWKTTTPDKDRIIIQLDPGAAFGTGWHPTTRLCLLRLEQHLQPGMLVFDLGTGTGILSIAAVKLGADNVLAVDIDPVAVTSARSNARENGVADKIQIRRGTLSLNTRRKYRGAFDIAMANITARAISELSPGLAEVLKPGGILIVSGIHAEGLDEVLVSLALANLNLKAVDTEGHWHAVSAEKPGIKPG